MLVYVVIESVYVPAEAPCPLETVLAVHSTLETAKRDRDGRKRKNKDPSISFVILDYPLVGVDDHEVQ